MIIIFLCAILSFTTPFWSSLGLGHSSKPTAKAASALVRRINIPYFNTSAVPFNQTAIFWFGSVSSSDNYTDVRMGYNNNELYVDLHIVDRYLWYDPNAKAPNLTKGDTATVYLSTNQNGSNAPDQSAYKFVAQVDWYQPRTHYQQAYRGNGSTWVASPVAFNAVSGWRGTGFNGKEDSGWTMTYHIPFSSLGRSGHPPQGTAWKLGIKVHNQDNASDTPLSLKWWPETENDMTPSSWGALVFGLSTYQAPHTTNNATFTVRNGLNKQVVTDGMVGGSLGCYNKGLNRWTGFGGQSYPGATRVNIQNEWDTSDWNCFSKFYISFPLNSLSAGKGVVSAKVTLHEYGGSGTKGKPTPSLIQVASVNEGWNPATLAWNNAPLVKENISRTVVNTVSNPTPSGQPYSWDVSKALADAYAAGQPLRLVFYSSDSPYNTGKYFFSSAIADWNAQSRPTLQATLGNVAASSPTSVQSSASRATLAPAARGQLVALGGLALDTQQTLPPAKVDEHLLYFAPLFLLPAPLFFLLWTLRRRRFLKRR
ncbi:MAG: DNRLRE domain-containing protein [Ktedonobacteraceae bacterium]